MHYMYVWFIIHTLCGFSQSPSLLILYIYSALSFLQDPFAPSEGSAEAAQELDLFAMKPTETSVPVVTPTTSAATPAPASTPTPAAAVAPPAPATTATTTATTTTATTSATTTTTTTSAPPPALDIFGGNLFLTLFFLKKIPGLIDLRCTASANNNLHVDCMWPLLLARNKISRLELQKLASLVSEK